MAFDFPSSPIFGQKFPASPVVGMPTYTWDGVALYEPPVGWTLVPVDEGEYYEFGKPRGVTPPAVVVTSKPT